MMEAAGLERVQNINSIKAINCRAPIANRMVALPVYQYQSSIMEARGMRYIFCGTFPSYNQDSQLGKRGFKCLCTRIYYVMSFLFPGREVSCATKSFTLAGVDLFTDCLNLHAHPTNPPWKTFTLKLYASSNTMPGLAASLPEKHSIRTILCWTICFHLHTRRGLRAQRAPHEHSRNR